MDNETKKISEYSPPIPYPQRLITQQNTKSQEYLELFKQVHINIPLLDAIIHVIPAIFLF